MTERVLERGVPRTGGGWRQTWRRFRRSWRGTAALCFLAFLALVAFFAPMLANTHPIACRYDARWHFPALVETFQGIPFLSSVLEKDPPFRYASFDYKASFDPERDWALPAPVPFGPLEATERLHEPPSPEHWLGTDSSGRDVLARLIHGAQVSMKVGFVSMGIAALIGILLGAAAGYHGGWTDILISRLIEVVMCFPVFFLILAILAWFPPRIENVMVVIGLTRWDAIARLTRGEFLRLRGVEYCLAARALGAGSRRIILRHLLPNALAPALVHVTFGIAAAILVEAGLSWIGFGVQPPQPSWGSMLRESYSLMMTTGHMVVPACAAIFLAVLAFNLVGDSLRDAIDPRSGNDSARPRG